MAFLLGSCKFALRVSASCVLFFLFSAALNLAGGAAERQQGCFAVFSVELQLLFASSGYTAAAPPRSESAAETQNKTQLQDLNDEPRRSTCCKQLGFIKFHPFLAAV